ncbi:ubiquinone biosynthesis protein COQ9 [Cordyceps fumosorosea ARSEF 2679]|uniref:Ubiquinone biosynthesis protein n=1 Tax=Cordyceps fumosorosea (strain ARSEF 2679) TaxID=1081104 RepID=A0A162LPK5_CORFA|nr:ubiquinone biosynthesis protein COQ9 [Cordyceps fumosorosea ARSEF 2679]OAA73784.1 ubiquinone biosynthesis protein COQ9 [Cordyceps fumosorosea ARSEF 2679]
MSAAIVTTRAAARRVAAHCRATTGGVCCPRRSYHSYDHPPTAGPFGGAEEAILAAAYRHVPEHGFSARALGLGARDAGYLDVSPSVLPDGGAFALIRYHLVSQRLGLASASDALFKQQQQQQQRVGVGAKVAALTWARLLGNRDVIQHWQEALAVMAQPSHVPESLKELAKLSDEIWFLAGDTAVDPSWYSKRATLSMIYTTAELFMTNDRSPDLTETNKFLARRLEEVQSVGGAVGAVGQWTGFTFQAAVNVLRSKGLGI